MDSSNLKKRRVARACDFCHKRRLKCRPALSTTSSCKTCLEYNVACTQTRELKKRGSSKHQRTYSSYPEPLVHPISIDGHGWALENQGPLSASVLDQLIAVYFDTVYPMYFTLLSNFVLTISFPFFHETTFLRSWNARTLPADRASYASLMALCALSARHVQDGAVFITSMSSNVDTIDPQVYLKEALRGIPADLNECRGLEYLRAFGLLSLLGNQMGNPGLHHQYMGLYHALLAQDGLHDEARWPKSMTPVEIQVRRMLYWSMYRLEVHTAIVYGHMTRMRESQSPVSYPKEPNEMTQNYTGNYARDDWITGWNIITDLYRVLEHAVDCFRTSVTQSEPMFKKVRPILSTPAQCLEEVMTLQAQLPEKFNQAPQPSLNVDLNRCGFQVANLACTIRLVKVICFTKEEATFQSACRVAQELAENVRTIPVEYFRAIGSPMLQELSGVGHVLGSVVGKHLSELEYGQLRDVLLSVAAFLGRLDQCMSSSGKGAEARFRQHIDRIERHVATLRKETRQAYYMDDLSNAIIIPSELLEGMPWLIEM